MSQRTFSKRETLLGLTSLTASLAGCIFPVPQDPEDTPTAAPIIENISSALSEYNLSDTSWDFDNIRNVAKTMEWCRRDDGKYVISRDTSQDSIGAEFYDITDYTGPETADELIDKIWEDEEGMYDNFGEIINEFDTSSEHETITEAAKALEA